MKAALKELQEGIYFNMLEAEYHALPYFSRSFADEVLCDLEEAKYRQENPVEQTAAMDLGTAIHSMFLEPKIFNEIYVRYPSFEDFAGKTILKTGDDLKDFLASVGEKKTGVKEELIARAKPYIDPEKFVIWDEKVAEFMAMVSEKGLRILSNPDFETIQGIKESYAKRTQIQEILSGGYSEVTIIWRDEETGIMCKCRLDYVRPEAIGEVKSFSMKYKKPIMEYLFKEIVMQKYNFQFSIYSQALETIIKKIRGNKAKVYGEVDAEWLKKFLENSRKQFFIVFCRTAAPYQIKAIELERGVDGAQNNSYYQIASDMWRMALNKYDRAIKSGIWTEKEVETLDDIHVPSVMYQAPIY
jgi:hypothetical protein